MEESGKRNIHVEESLFAYLFILHTCIFCMMKMIFVLISEGHKSPLPVSQICSSKEMIGRVSLSSRSKRSKYDRQCLYRCHLVSFSILISSFALARIPLHQTRLRHLSLANLPSDLTAAVLL